jgi:hypothetical protein
MANVIGGFGDASRRLLRGGAQGAIGGAMCGAVFGAIFEMVKPSPTTNANTVAMTIAAHAPRVAADASLLNAAEMLSERLPARLAGFTAYLIEQTEILAHADAQPHSEIGRTVEYLLDNGAQESGLAETLDVFCEHADNVMHNICLQ